MSVQFNEIEEKIFDGLREACNDSFSFSGDAFAQIEPEYIVTTNVAKSIKSINDNNNMFGDPLIIVIEEDTKTFATECVPQLIWNNVFSPSLINSRHNSNRDGKIDIALYEKTPTQLGRSRVPKCCIELKKFSPVKREVVKDVVRNVEYMNLVDPKTGNSQLEKTYFACLESDRGCIYKSFKQNGIKNIESKYSNMLSAISSSLASLGLSMRIVVQTVAQDLLDTNQNFGSMDDDSVADRVSQLFHHAGVLVVVERISLASITGTVN